MSTRSPFFPPADEHSHSVWRRWIGSCRYWLFQALGWGVFWLVLTLGSFTSGAPEAVVQREILAQTALALVLVGTSHLLRVCLLFLRRRQYPVIISLALVTVAVVAAAVAASCFWLYWTSSDTLAADLPVEHDFFLPLAVFAFGISLLLGVWVCLYTGYHYYVRYQQSVVERLRLDATVKDAELRALRAQVNPHFLFNSLNTLRAMIPREMDRPREAITLLADLLRASLTMGMQRTITLAHELETVNNYLALEQLRFEERLRLTMAIAPEACTCVLPPFVLQTLVENALKFGVAPFEEGGTVEITAAVREGALDVSVRNRGALNAGSASTGVGLKNARARLAMLCGPEAGITLSQDGQYVVARLHIPARPAAPISLHP